MSYVLDLIWLGVLVGLSVVLVVTLVNGMFDRFRDE